MRIRRERLPLLTAQRPPDSSKKPTFVIFRQFMLPHPQHAPASRPQGAAHQPVPLHVGSELITPELPMVDRQARVLRAAVPKAPIHEQDDTLFAEDEIGPAENHRMPPPAGDAVSAEQFCHRQFGGLVPAPANARHDLRALGGGEYISHGDRRRISPQVPSGGRLLMRIVHHGKILLLHPEIMTLNRKVGVTLIFGKSGCPWRPCPHRRID